MFKAPVRIGVTISCPFARPTGDPSVEERDFVTNQTHSILNYMFAEGFVDPKSAQNIPVMIRTIHPH
jgi:hypothetical protein